MGCQFPRIPGYVLGDPIGSGGSGTVWRGTDRASGEAVALKHLPVPDAASLAAARSEAAVLMALEHPNLIRLRETVALADALVLALDFAPRGSLAALLSRRRLTPGEVITALAGIASAVAYAHGVGIVHGDISPANIVFTERGEPVLTDLGLARLLGSTATVGGTPGYLDPVLTDGMLPSPLTDVYSLGAVAFHALTGSTLEPSTPPADALAAADVPVAMRAVVVRALGADMDRRGSAADFALDLRHSGHPVAVEFEAGRAGVPMSPAPTRAVRVPPRPDPVARRRRLLRRRLLKGGGAAVAGTGVAAAALLVLSGGTDGTAESRASEPPSHHPSPSVTPSRAMSSSAPPSVAPVVVSDAESAAVVLHGLDGLRERAYAQGDAGLLDRVYAAGDLLAKDRAQLATVVPAGCGLVGVRTSYGALALISHTASTAVLSAQITLPGSVLHCPGKTDRAAAASPPTPVRITLQRKGNTYLIAAIDAL